MKRIGNILIGFLIGLLVAMPVNAAVQEYILKQSGWKIVVDGVEIKDERYPVLLLDPGYNYLAAGLFRSICDKIGLGFEADAETKEIRINTKQQAQLTTESKGVERVSIASEKITKTVYEDCKAIIYNDKQYINCVDYGNKFNVGFKAKDANNIVIFTDDNQVIININDDNKIITVEGSFYVELSVLKDLTK